MRRRGVLWWVGGGITRGGARGALAGWRWHHSRGREGCSGGLAVASLEGARGLLSRFDCVYSDYILQGCPGGALAIAMSLRARCFFFPTNISSQSLKKGI
jgi:hypothetical protein